MADDERKMRTPDGYSITTPVGISGTYYVHPGSPTAPRVTVTGGLNFGTSGAGAHAVFLRNGMTSEDTLGYGLNGNLSSILPSVTANGSVPDVNLVPQPWKAKVSSIEAGVSTPGASVGVSYTWTPQQITDFLLTHGLIAAARFGSVLPREALTQSRPPSSFVLPTMGPDDELPAFARTLRSGAATVGATSELPVRYLGSRYADPLEGGMRDWRYSVESVPPQPGSSSSTSGGMLGLLQDYLRNQR